jgi:hypothetical protein
MIGIGLIFLLHLDFFPWILAVAGASSFPKVFARRGMLGGLQSMLWLFGIAILAWTDAWFPGILILIGLSSLLKAVSFEPRGEKPKREYDEESEKAKRGVSLDDILEHGRTNDGEIYIPDEEQEDVRYS